jgi:hypothetical protein
MAYLILISTTRYARSKAKCFTSKDGARVNESYLRRAASLSSCALSQAGDAAVSGTVNDSDSGLIALTILLLLSDLKDRSKIE